MKHKPFFIVLDGIDGSGTTTHSNLLTGFLEHKKYKVHLTKEPTNNEIGILLRKYLKNKTIPPSVDALLFAADRAYHYLIEIKNKLDENHVVISDRYIESSIVYQSIQSNELSMDWVKIINKFAKKPDLTIILDIDPKVSLARKNEQEFEKFEDIEFLNNVRELYLSRAKEENHIVINSDDIIEIVQEKIQEIVLNYIE